jgi:hypothetical protein
MDDSCKEKVPDEIYEAKFDLNPLFNLWDEETFEEDNEMRFSLLGSLPSRAGKNYFFSPMTMNNARIPAGKGRVWLGVYSKIPNVVIDYNEETLKPDATCEGKKGSYSLFLFEVDKEFLEDIKALILEKAPREA